MRADSTIDQSQLYSDSYIGCTAPASGIQSFTASTTAFNTAFTFLTNSNTICPNEGNCSQLLLQLCSDQYCSDGQVLASSTVSVSDGQEYTWLYPNFPRLITNSVYYFSYNCLNKSHFSLRISQYKYDRGDLLGLNGTYDLYFKTYYDYDNIFNILSDIKVDIPDTRGWEYYSMPNNIVFHYKNALGLYHNVIFQIHQLTYPGGIKTYSNVANANGAIKTATSSTLGFATFYLPTGSYEIYNAHFLTNEAVNYITVPIQFGVSTGTSTPGNINASSTIPQVFKDCNDPITLCNDIELSTGITDLHIWGDLECGLKHVGCLLFQPSDQSILNFTLSFEQIKQSFPFNSFFGITSAFQEGLTATSTNDNMFPIPFITATGTITTMDIMGSSTLPNLIGSTNNNTFRTSLIYFAWLLDGLIIYLTVRKI